MQPPGTGPGRRGGECPKSYQISGLAASSGRALCARHGPVRRAPPHSDKGSARRLANAIHGSKRRPFRTPVLHFRPLIAVCRRPDRHAHTAPRSRTAARRSGKYTNDWLLPATSGHSAESRIGRTQISIYFLDKSFAITPVMNPTKVTPMKNSARKPSALAMVRRKSGAPNRNATSAAVPRAVVTMQIAIAADNFIGKPPGA